MPNKIAFIGDTHFDSRTPLSRIDDYRELTLNKLSTLRQELLKRGVEHLIITGDVFDSPDQSIIYLNSLMQELRKFKDNNITIYSIIGNHDFVHNNLDYFNRSALNILFQAGLIKHLTKTDLMGYTIYGIDWTKRDMVEAIPKDNKTIIVQHYATDDTIPYESISRDELKGVRFIVAGHDHKPYQYLETDNPIVLRPGSFTRRTKDQYNLLREIIYYVFDTSTNTIETHVLPTKPANEVFTNAVFNEKASTLLGNDFSQVFNENYFKKEIITFESLIQDLPMQITKETKDYLIKYLTELGEIGNETK